MLAGVPRSPEEPRGAGRLRLLVWHGTAWYLYDFQAVFSDFVINNAQACIAGGNLVYETRMTISGGVARSSWREAHAMCWMIGGEMKSILKIQVYS